MTNTNCLFEEPWWLDLVAPNEWEEVIVEGAEGVEARLPFVRHNQAGMKFIGMPPLTQTLGPWIKPSEKMRKCDRIAEDFQRLSKLIDQLPPHDFFRQDFHYTVESWLPFYWRGFEQTTRYTHVIENLKDIKNFSDQYRPNTKQKIKKASKLVEIANDLDISDFYATVAKTFTRQNKAMPWSINFIERIVQACKDRKCGETFFAVDEKSNVHAAAFMVWDERSAYFLISGADPEYRNSGAMNLIIDRAIQHAMTVTERFDFEGSMIEPIELAFRGYGGTPMPYMRITGMSQKMKMAWHTRQLFKAIAGK